MVHTRCGKHRQYTNAATLGNSSRGCDTKGDTALNGRVPHHNIKTSDPGMYQWSRHAKADHDASNRKSTEGIVGFDQIKGKTHPGWNQT